MQTPAQLNKSSLRLLLVIASLFLSANPNDACSLDAHRTTPVLLPSSNNIVPANDHKAVLNIPGQVIPHTLERRRMLSNDPLKDAADALKSQLAGAQAAASEEGKEASKAADHFFSTILDNANTTGAAAPVASPQQYNTTIEETTALPAYAFAPGPGFGAALAPAATITHLPLADTVLVTAATAPAAESPLTATLERAKAVPEYQLGAFLLEMARLINNTQYFNGTHAVLGAKLAQKQLQAEASNWLAQQTNLSASSASPPTNGKRRSLKDAPSVNPVTIVGENLVKGFENLPQNVTDTSADFGDHLVTQAWNATYYMEQFKSFLHKLKEPVAVQAGMQLFSNSPCLFSTNLGAIEASATGVSVSPSLMSFGATGVNVAPQAISISPALLSLGATGINVAPQGLNIAPALIAVTPGNVAINPQGGTISPVGLSVTAPADPAKKPSQPGGRRMLQQTATEQTAAPATNTNLPVPLHGLGNWAAVVGKMCQSAADQSGHDEANACLSDYFNNTNTKLDYMADKYKDLKGGDLFAALGHDFPKMEIKAPTFYSGSDDIANSNVAALQFGATGFSFSPCAVAASPAAINIGPTGISISPTAISASATGVNVQPQGINISPDLIVVGPYDKTFAGQGLNIAPALITVSPTREAVNPVGPLKISDAMVTKTLPALPTPGDKS